MESAQERTLNQGAYRRLKEQLARTYEWGRFVAISEGRVVADAASLEDIRALLTAQGKDPTRALVVQAGVDYPETAVIFPLLRTL
jgi:hypothetical protein